MVCEEGELTKEMEDDGCWGLKNGNCRIGKSTKEKIRWKNLNFDEERRDNDEACRENKPSMKGIAWDSRKENEKGKILERKGKRKLWRRKVATNPKLRKGPPAKWSFCCSQERKRGSRTARLFFSKSNLLRVNCKKVIIYVVALYTMQPTVLIRNHTCYLLLSNMILCHAHT